MLAPREQSDWSKDKVALQAAGNTTGRDHPTSRNKCSLVLSQKEAARASSRFHSSLSDWARRLSAHSGRLNDSDGQKAFSRCFQPHCKGETKENHCWALESLSGGNLWGNKLRAVWMETSFSSANCQQNKVALRLSISQHFYQMEFYLSCSKDSWETTFVNCFPTFIVIAVNFVSWLRFFQGYQSHLVLQKHSSN